MGVWKTKEIIWGWISRYENKRPRLQNLSSTVMLHALETYGYHLNIVQLRDPRLHPSFRILFRDISAIAKAEIEQVADTGV